MLTMLFIVRIYGIEMIDRFFQCLSFIALLCAFGVFTLSSMTMFPADAVSDDSYGYRVFQARLGTGDSLRKVLNYNGISNSNAMAVETAVGGDLRRLPVGSKVLAVVGADNSIDSIKLYRGNSEPVMVDRFSESGRDSYKARVASQRCVITKVSGVVLENNTLLKVAKQLGATTTLIKDFERLYGNSANFNSMAPGSRFEIMFERFFNSDGSFSHDGKILYATLNSGKSSQKLYLIKDMKGKDGYYMENGVSWEKTANFTSPLQIKAIVTSGFGMRKHPITGKLKMHQGVDLAVPAGTKVYASADGAVVFAGYNKGYGNYVKLDHGSNRQTLYAHLKGFATGLRQGQRVHQGQLIGYVGSTGMSTGNHLHYEIINIDKNGRARRTDPIKGVVEIARGSVTKFHDMGVFRQSISGIDALLDAAPVASKQ